jgi:hypothetical protein
MNSDLLRQRRNLIAISVALLLLKFPEDPISAISILGAEMKVTSAYSLPVFAAVLLGYFLTRYYQYHKAQGDTEILSSVRSFFKGRVAKYHCKRIDVSSFIGELVLERRGVHWNYFVRDRRDDLGPMVDTTRERLPLFQSWWWWLEGYGHITLRTTKVTDYVIPYLLAAAAAIQLIVGFMH